MRRLSRRRSSQVARCASSRRSAEAEAVGLSAPVGRQRRPARCTPSWRRCPNRSATRASAKSVSGSLFPGACSSACDSSTGSASRPRRRPNHGTDSVVPRDVLLALLAHAPKRRSSGRGTNTRCFGSLFVASGARRIETVLDCHVPGMPAWDMGVDIDTGAPPSIAAQMLVSGQIAATGVLPPEQVIPARPFFRRSAGAGCGSPSGTIPGRPRPVRRRSKAPLRQSRVQCLTEDVDWQYLGRRQRTAHT